MAVHAASTQLPVHIFGLSQTLKTEPPPKDYQKVSPPELSEIEENESDSNSMAFSMALRSRSKK